MNLDQRLSAFSSLGARLATLADSFVHNSPNDHFEEMLNNVRAANPWFTLENCLYAVREWTKLLQLDSLSAWIEPYKEAILHVSPHSIGVINAGNIPMVGFHDFLSVLMCGHNYLGKNASDDTILLPFIAAQLTSLAPELEDKIHFVDRLAGFDAVIATGSNNSSRYFEYYFGKYPHIIRRNRTGIAVIEGAESKTELAKLGDDIFRYYGLGCRSISKLFVPEGYNFNQFFEAIFEFGGVMEHNKYMNNFEYNNALYLLKRCAFLQNGFLIVIESPVSTSPIAVLHSEFYSGKEDLLTKLKTAETDIQCISVNRPENFREIKTVKFGETQAPGLADYADGVDTVKFLSQLG